MNILEKIAQLVYDYSKNKKIPDTNLASKVIELLIEYYNVCGYVDNAYITGIGGDYLCGYDFYDKIIYIDIERLYQYIINEMEKEINLLNLGDYTYLRINLNFVRAIAHEVFHARQYKKIANKDKDLEKDLLELSFENNCLIIKALKENRRLTPTEAEYIKFLNKLEEDQLYYKALPSERMANISASKLGNEISELYDDEYFSIYQNMKYESSKIDGYFGEGQYPTPYISTYHNKIKNALGITYNAEESYDAHIRHYNLLSRNYDLSEDDKLYFGLPISESTYSNQNDKVSILTKKLIDKKSQS